MEKKIQEFLVKKYDNLAALILSSCNSFDMSSTTLIYAIQKNNRKFLIQFIQKNDKKTCLNIFFANKEIFRVIIEIFSQNSVIEINQFLNSLYILYNLMGKINLSPNQLSIIYEIFLEMLNNNKKLFQIFSQVLNPLLICIMISNIFYRVAK